MTIQTLDKTGSATDYNGSFAVQSDDPSGVNHSTVFNRLEGSFSGPLAGRLTFALTGLPPTPGDRAAF